MAVGDWKGGIFSLVCQRFQVEVALVSRKRAGYDLGSKWGLTGAVLGLGKMLSICGALLKTPHTLINTPHIEPGLAVN